MKHFTVKVISVIIILCLSTPLVFSYGLTNVVYADSNTEFAVKTARIVKRYDLNVKNPQANSAGLKLRIIGKVSDGNIDFSSFGFTECVINKDGRFVMQFKSEATLKKCLNSLSSNPSVIYAEQDRLIFVNSEKTETKDNYSWGVAALGIDAYSEYLASVQSENSVTVAVVDSGIAGIDCLKEKLVPGYDFVDNDSDGANDTSIDSHGTFLASIIAECTHDVPVNIMPVRVLASRNGSLINAVNGIYYAVDNGADIVNISLGGNINNCRSLDDAIEYADTKNASVVVCSGNTKSDTADYCPAHNEKAITVSSVDESLMFSESFSNYGEAVDVCAPGVNISGCSADGTLKTMNGTSMSAAYISAGTALFRLHHPQCNTKQVQTSLKKSCVDLGETGFDVYYGYGLPQFDKFILDETVYVESVSFSQTDLAVTVGETKNIIINIYPSDSSDKSVRWISGNTEIVSVSETGVITANKAGTATLTAETNDGSYTATVNIIVSEPQAEPVVIGVSVAEPPSKKTYIYKSKEEMDLTGIKLKVLYSDGSEETVTDPNLITVSGFDTSVVGEINVTLEYAGYETETAVTVEYAWWQWIIRILLLGFLWY